MANFNWNDSSNNNYGIVAQEVGELYDGSIEYELADSSPSNTIHLTDGANSMVTISSEGFWVRGVKVPQDDKEAETVYNAFKQWLTWANLSR